MRDYQRLIQFREYVSKIVSACREGDGDRALTLLGELEHDYADVVTPLMVAQCEQLIHDNTMA